MKSDRSRRTTIAPGRAAAYRVLRSVSSGHADLPAALERARSRLADERDRALTSEIATGVQRWRAALDHVISGLSKRPLDDLDPEVLDILRLSAYQIIHLTRVPGAAVVNDAVNLTKAARKPGATGFVNALLRSLSRQRDDERLRLPPRPADAQDRQAALNYLSITLSHPRWLAARWLDRYGFEATERWLLLNNMPAPVTLRANRLRVTREDLASRLSQDGVIVRPGRFAPDALIVEGDRAGPRLLRRDAGSFVIQSEESQLVAMIAGPAEDSRVLDTCASPGGKTTALAAAMQGRGLIVACDVRDRRMRLLRRSVRAAGADNVRMVQADLLGAPPPFFQVFDCVLVDAPCSGLGILRRDPDIRWRRREEDLPALASAQLAMLEHAADAVTPGGRLVYATCSSEREENESIVDRFLAGRAEFEAVDLRQGDAHLPAAVIDERGFLRTSPHLQGLDAFFGALLRRRA